MDIPNLLTKIPPRSRFSLAQIWRVGSRPVLISPCGPAILKELSIGCQNI